MQRKAFGKTIADLQVGFIFLYFMCVYFCALLSVFAFSGLGEYE